MDRRVAVRVVGLSSLEGDSVLLIGSRGTAALAAGSVVLAGCTTGAPGASAAADRARWSEPHQLGPSGHSVDVAVNNHGDMATLWTSEHLAKARYRPAEENWRKPVKVGDRASAPSIILDDRGWATALWHQNGAAIRKPGQRWRFDPENPFTDHLTFAGQPVMATTPDGLLYLTWTDSDDAGAGGFPAYGNPMLRSPAGHWDWIDELPNGATGSNTAAAFTPNRTLNVAHEGSYGGLSITRMRRGSSEATTVQVTDKGVVGVGQLVSNERGDLVAVGIQHHPDRWAARHIRLLAYAKPQGRRWRPLFSHPIRYVREPAVALNDRGRVAITWLKGRTDNVRVMGRTLRIRGRADGGARGLSAKAHDVLSPDVALDPAGRAVFLWVGGRKADSFTPQAVRRSPKGHWGKRRRLARPDGTAASQPQIVARGRARFTAVYVDERPMYVDLGR